MLYRFCKSLPPTQTCQQPGEPEVKDAPESLGESVSCTLLQSPILENAIALWIPVTRGEASSLQWGYAQGPPTNPRLPLHSTSQEQLSLNPGGEDCGVGSPELGPKLARSFLHYWNSKGGFIACKQLWDLLVLLWPVSSGPEMSCVTPKAVRPEKQRKLGPVSRQAF